MIQINLIPDLKAEYLRSIKLKRLVFGISSIVSTAFLGVTIALFLYVNVAQKNHSDNLSEDITTLSNEYTASGDVAKIVSVQRQLQALPGLHLSKPEISRVITYLSVVTPKNIEYRSYSLDLEQQIMTIEGTAKEVIDVNTFVDTIKNAVYTIGKDTDKIPAFSGVILESISTRDDEARFSISLSFDETIFTSKEEVKLSVPKINSTQSEVARPKSSTNSPVDDANENNVFDSSEGGN